MPHMSENSVSLEIHKFPVSSLSVMKGLGKGFNDVLVLFLPQSKLLARGTHQHILIDELKTFAESLGPSATLVIVGSPVDLVHAHQAVSGEAQYQLWIALRTSSRFSSDKREHLPQENCGATVYTRYAGQLRHTKTRLAYTYCPACGKTTKDYGGKKHTYHNYGTLISDVWRDIAYEQDDEETPLLARLADLFGILDYRELRALFVADNVFELISKVELQFTEVVSRDVKLESRLVNGDCLDYLRTLPSNAVDFAFADPPYNLNKVYGDYSDDREIQSYFTWCDEWITELARVLRPGGTLALLNIPLWSVRHFLHMETILEYRNWIVWDALSFPVRLIMPAHYTILCFSKGEPSPLANLSFGNGIAEFGSNSKDFADALKPLREGYCLRAPCISRRNRTAITDRGMLTDIWSDIHRLKHNSRRVDHPCQVPPSLMYRLIGVFTQPGDLVLEAV